MLSIAYYVCIAVVYIPGPIFGMNRQQVEYIVALHILQDPCKGSRSLQCHPAHTEYDGKKAGTGTWGEGL
jgi:hypothetical protein